MLFKKALWHGLAYVFAFLLALQHCHIQSVSNRFCGLFFRNLICGHSFGFHKFENADFQSAANGSIVLISGNPIPRSHRLTALSVTSIFEANSACVMFLSLRHSATKAPN